MRPRNAALGSLALLALLLLGLSGCATSEAERWYSRAMRSHSQETKIVNFTKAIELEPDYVIAYLDRSVVYIKKRLHDKAIADLNKAIRLKPDYAVAFYNRGLAYKNIGRYDLAIQDYTEAIRLNPDYAFAYVNRGNAYSERGVYNKAIEDKTKAIILLEGKGDKRNLSVAYFSRGVSYRKKGSSDRAIADLNKAIELDPENAHPYNHLAWVFATSPDTVLRNGKRAVELAERASKLDWDAHNLDTLAAAYAEVGRFEEAISTQVQAIALLKMAVDKNFQAEFEKRLKHYRTRKPWRVNEPEDSSDDKITATKLVDLAEQNRARGKYAGAAPRQGRALAIREKTRQQGKARKGERQKNLEALSGRYSTAGGRSKWDISFRDNLFEARYLGTGGWSLRYDGTVIGTRIYGRAYLGLSSFCRELPTPPLYGSVDLHRKSFEISWVDYDIVQMRRHKKCVPITAQRKWTQEDR